MSRADELRAQLEIVEAEEALVEAHRAARTAYLVDSTEETKVAKRLAAEALATFQAENASAQAQGLSVAIVPRPIGASTTAPTPGTSSTGEREG